MVKNCPDGRVDNLKTHLVAEGYTHIYASYYYDTFSPVTKIDLCSSSHIYG